MADDCIFCNIAAGELPSETVQEDEHNRGVHGSEPVDARARLVIPRRHSRNLYEVDDEDLGHAVAASRRLALRMRERLGCDGVNLLNCWEPAAWQTVFHTHIHVIPRYDDDPLQLPVRPRQAEQDELAKVAAELR
jgi:histidine triad (HIT) family protein